MTTDKKNQHYIPKFYLRNFSYHDNKKQIGVYNILNQYFIQKGKLKTQGSRNFFYGCDGVIEDSLSDIEGKLAALLKDIINNKTLPRTGTQGHFELLLFVTSSDLRNPVRIDGAKEIFSEMRKSLLEIDPKTDVEKLVPNIPHDTIVKMHLSYAVELSKMILDLDYKLLINETPNPVSQRATASFRDDIDILLLTYNHSGCQ
jgi:hypothetical protein